MSDNGEVVDAEFEVQEDETDGLAVAEQETPATVPLLAASEREKLQALREQQRDAQRELEDCKSELKSAKLRLDACTDAISRYIDSLGQPELPFGGEVGEATAEAADAWRQVPLAEAIGAVVTPKVLEVLAEAEIRTVGELADWTCDRPLTYIKGIGEAKAEQIEQALEDFWAKRSIKDPLGMDAPVEDQDDFGNVE